jgi:hypothetical protein
MLYLLYNNTSGSFFSVYNQNLKFSKEIQIDKSICSHDSFELSMEHIFLTGKYRDHYNVVNKQLYLFLINYEGRLLRKINLTCKGLHIDNILNIFRIRFSLIYFLTNDSKLVKVDFTNSILPNNNLPEERPLNVTTFINENTNNTQDNFFDRALNDESIKFIDCDEENGEAFFFM